MTLRDALQAVLGGSHTIERELAGGGMSTVFVAHDNALGRRIVVKILDPALAAGVNADRFQREIRVAAQLVHPHIVPLLNAGEVEGLPYYTMPLMEGESLRARLQQTRSLPVQEVLRVASQVADALDYAHRQGIVHRDIKPENILLHDGNALVTDFGIAKAVTSARVGSPVQPEGEPHQLTAHGMAIGTAAYMSPEQAEGAPDIDGRADIYALGCVLYELLTGSPPYRGPNAYRVILQHVQSPVPRVRDLRAELPASLDDAIATAMAKRPDQRFASASGFRAALGATLSQDVGRRSTRWIAGAAVAVGMVAVAVGAASMWDRIGAPEPARSVAVLPLVNASGDTAQQYFVEGMTDEITGALVRLPGLRVASRSAASFIDTRAPLVHAEVARRLNVTTLLEGRVRREKNRMRLTMQLTNASDGLSLWSQSFDVDLRDAFAVQDQIAARVAAELRVALSDTAGRRPVNPEAHDLVMRGRYLMEQYTAQPLREAVTLFERAIAIDSTYVEAWAGLADAWSRRADIDTPGRVALPAFRNAVARAMALDSTRATVLTQLAVIRGWIDRDVPAAERILLRAISADSTYDVAYVWYAVLLLVDGRRDSSVALLQRLSRIDPSSRLLLQEAPTIALYAKRLNVARDFCSRAMHTDSAQLGDCRYELMEAEGRHEELLSQCRARRFERCTIVALAQLGRREEARQLAKRYEAAQAGRWLRPLGMATLWAQVGDADRAITWLEREVADSGGGVLMFRLYPQLASLQGNPRFEDLARRARVPPAAR